MYILITILLLVIAFIESATSKLEAITVKTKVGSLNFSPIGLGTWSWGNRFLWQYNKDEDEILKETFNYVTRNGITWFDTGDSYGTGKLNGRAEELLGKFSCNDKNNRNYYFATKLACYPWRIGVDSMIKAAKESADRMQRPIDCLQLHWPPTLQWQEKEYLTAFCKLVKDGTVTQIGVSNYGPKGLKRVNDIVKNQGCQIYSNQVQFSLLSRYPLHNGLTVFCEEENIQLIGYSALALGLLGDKYTLDNLPSGPRSLLFKDFLPSIEPLLKAMREIAIKKKKTVGQVALNWNLSKGFLVLVGIRSLTQAKENLDATGWKLTQSEIELLDRISASIPKQIIQNSFQSDRFTNKVISEGAWVRIIRVNQI